MNSQSSQPNSYKILTFHGSNSIPEAYRGLVQARWARSLKYGNDYFRLIDPPAYWAIYPKLIEMLLSSANAIVRIAVLSDDEDVALGFSVAEGDTLHYVHVDKDQRRQGIARALIPPHVRCITHLTKTGVPLWTAAIPHAKFNPFRS